MFSRTGFLAGAGALAASAYGGAADAQGTGPRNRIDVHCHLSPPFYAEASQSVEPLPAVLRRWSVQRQLADMDAAGVATGILSMPSDPGIYFGNVAAARTLARRCNDYMAGLRRAHPGRYGFFAALPMPDVDGSLTEIAYALDVLKADGIGLFTSYGSKYLGDPSFAPVWAELHRRKALVFTHPLTNECCKEMVPGVNGAIIEFGTDTTRAIASLVFGGTASRYPNARVIFSHAGGTMPFLIARFRAQAHDMHHPERLPHGVDYELRRYFYDTAQAATAEAIGALLTLVPPTQVLFGTDFPYKSSLENVRGLAALHLPAAVADAIGHLNAGRLLTKA